MKTPIRVLVGSLAVFTTGLLTSDPAYAANKTWDGDGADDFWQTGANWDADTAPSALDLLFFGGATRLTPSNNFTAGAQFNGITFSAGAGAFTLGGNGIVLGTPLTGVPSSGNITNSSSNLQTISMGVTLGAGNHTIAGGASGLALNPTGGLLRNAGATAIFSGTVSTSTISNSNGGILGAWATVGTNWATVNGSNNIVALSSYTDITTTGTIASDATANVRINSGVAGTVTLAASGVTDINTLMQTVNNITEIVDVGTGNTLRLGAQGGLFRTGTSNTTGLTIGTGIGTAVGTLTAGGADNTAGEIVINAGAGTGTGTNIIVNSVITNNGTGVVSVVKSGRGFAAINGANTYTGGTFINEGRLGGTFGTGPVTVQSGGQAIIGGMANDFFIAGIGPQNEAGNGAIRSGGILSGTITLMGDSRISGTTNITGKITGGFALDIGAASNIGGTGATTTLSNPLNDWTGNTTIIGRTNGAGSHTLKLGANEVIPHGTGKGNLVIGFAGVNAGSLSTLDLAGFDETVNGLISAGTSANDFVQNSLADSTATLTVGGNNATATFAGTIRDNGGTGGIVALTKIGSGTQTLTGPNAYTGNTTILNGTLSISNPFLADTSTVLLTTGSLFNLNFVGTDTIWMLSIDGLVQSAGIWGAIGSGAQFETALITGTGLLLTTVPEPQHYALGIAGLLGALVLMRRRRAAIGLR